MLPDWERAAGPPGVCSVAGLTDSSLGWKTEQICFLVTSTKSLPYPVPLFSHLKTRGNYQDVLCKSPWSLLMKRLGKRQILVLSHSSSSLVSSFIIFPFLPVPPSTAGFTHIKRHYSQQLSCLGVDMKGGYASTVPGCLSFSCSGGLRSPRLVPTPHTTKDAGMLTGSAPSAACTGVLDTKSRPMKQWFPGVRGVSFVRRALRSTPKYHKKWLTTESRNLMQHSSSGRVSQNCRKRSLPIGCFSHMLQ